jgi:hypothetical protein
MHAQKHEIEVILMQKTIRGFLARRLYHRRAVEVLKALDVKSDPDAFKRQPTIVRQSYESIQKQLKILASMFKSDPDNIL